MTEWYETFFDALAHDVWRALMPPEVSDDEVAFLERALQLGDRPAARLLDVPCGEGRLALPMAARGQRVTGVDLSTTALDRLRKAPRRGGVAVDTLHGDMRALAAIVGPGARFDGAWCMGNSFGYLDVEGTNAFLAGVAGCLAADARFVVDAAMVAESVLPHLGGSERHQAGDCVLTTTNDYDVRRSTVVSTMVLQRGRQRSERVARHRVVTCRELIATFEDTGFEVVDIAGATDGTPFALGSPRCLVTARRARRAVSSGRG